MKTVELLREFVRRSLCEAIPVVKAPTNDRESTAFLDLVHWASSRMGVPDEDVEMATQKALTGDWTEAMELLKTFYIMKGVRASDARKKS